MNSHLTWRKFQGQPGTRWLGLTGKVTAVFVLFAALLLATVGSLAYNSGHNALREATIADLRSAAIEKEAALDRWMGERQTDVVSLAAMPDVIDDLAKLARTKAGSAAAQNARDDLVKRFHPFTGNKLLSLFVMAPDNGRIIASTIPHEEGQLKEDRPYFINGKNGSYVQGPYNSLVLGGPAITIAVPVKSPGGRLVGVLAARLNLGDMGAVINPKKDPHQTDDSYLVNRSNLFVTQPRFISDPVVMRRGIHTEAVKRGLRGESGYLLARDYRDVPTIAVYRWLPTHKLCLVVERDQKEAFAPSRAFGRVIMLIALLALVIASVVAAWLARTITRPVLALQAGAARFGRGEAGVRLPETAHNELGDLAREFNRMAAAISEREAALRKWAHIFEHAEWGIAISDSDRGNLDLINPTFARMYGYTIEELSGRPILEICTPKAQAELQKHIQLARARGHHTFESVHVRKEGAAFPALVDITTVKNEQGEALYLAIKVRDITERKRVEEEIRRNHETAERLAKEMAVIAEIGRVVGSTLDIHQVFERVDTEVSKLIPYDRLLVNLAKDDGNEFIVVYASGIDNPGRRLGDSYLSKGSTTHVVITTRAGILIQPEDAEEIKGRYPNLHATFKMGLRSTMSVPLISMDKAIGSLTFRSKKTKAYTEQDLRLAEKIGVQIAGAIVNAQIFDNLKKTEESLRESQECLNRAEKMEAIGQLAGGVAHDLNNVLGVSTIYSELLQEKIPEESPLRKYVDNILASTQKGAAIIQDLLTLTRRGVKASEVMNLNAIISNFLKTPEFENIQKHHPQVTFDNECQSGLLNITGSPLHLEKTLLNLVSNAAEAIPEKGEVTIRTENRYLDKPIRGYDEVKEGDYAVLTISDTGMGIPAENIGRIFEPFYTKKTMGRSGTGLGLAIVWGTVKDHHGYIDLHTEVGAGTVFTLYFPVTREELSAQQQKVPIERYLGAGESVLVVDDVAEQRDVAARLLIRLGYRVYTAASGEEAVEHLVSCPADILVLDMIMSPGIDGLETYRRVREINPKQKAIIVSGFAETERVKKAQEMGAGAYVRKPYLMEGIGLAIREELSR